MKKIVKFRISKINNQRKSNNYSIENQTRKYLINRNSLFDSAKTKKEKALIYKNVANKIIQINHENKLNSKETNKIEYNDTVKLSSQFILKRSKTLCKFFFAFSLKIKKNPKLLVNTSYKFIHKNEQKLKATHKSLFFPSDKFTNIWDFIISIFLLYVLIFMTFEMSFTKKKYLGFVILEYITTVVFIVDILVNFNKAYIDKKNQLIVSRKKIACQYLKCWFWIDLVAAFPFFTLQSLINQQMGDAFMGAKLLRIMSIIKLMRFFKMIRNVFYKIKNQNKILRIKNKNKNLVINISLVILTCHLFACIFYAVPYNFSKTNWIKERGLEGRSEIEMYLFALHWIVETVITVGYGENPLL